MTKSTVAVIGSGIVGAIIAHILTQKGHDVVIFEKGPEYPYPHIDQFTKKVHFMYDDPVYKLPKDIKNITLSGDYKWRMQPERGMMVGGGAALWGGMALRMSPNDFKTKSLYGFGSDWPVTYDDLELDLCTAEKLIGVSGTDDDNPFAPWRSKPYPLPPFELSYDDKILAQRLLKDNIVLHTTPQARTRAPYDGRDECANFGTCYVCPIGVRYSPNHHLELAKSTGLCKVLSNVSVRKVVVNGSGQAKSIVFQHNEESIEKEHAAKIVIIAGGATESVRLLLLSANSYCPDGIGNQGGQVGKNFTFHHIWYGGLHYKEPLYPGRFGGFTAQSHQFVDPPTRGKHGGIKIQFTSFPADMDKITKWGSRDEILEQLQPRLHWRPVGMHAESVPTPQKYITLGEKLDRFGDPFAHVHYKSDEFDYETHRFAEEIFKRFAKASEADEMIFSSVNNFSSGAHHMGGCCMGLNEQDSVVDKFSKIHGSSNLFVVGGSNFVGTSPVSPTLTIAALAVRAANYITDIL